MNRFRNNLFGIISVFVLLALYGRDVGYSAIGGTTIQTESNWKRDASNPVVTGNGITLGLDKTRYVTTMITDENK